MAVREQIRPEAGKVVDMAWDPITRIVGKLGIYTKIDFENREVLSCKATSSLFRGYSIFMKGKDPRDAHFITSRICGICGDNHAVCSCYAQQMAYGVKPPPLGEWIVNLGEAAEYIFDHILPGYEEVGRRRILLGCWGAWNNPDHVDYEYKNMDHWGNEMFVTPGVVVDGELVTTNLVDINLGIRILLGSSYYGDWVGEETFVHKDPLGNPVDKRHPWNQTTIPKPQKRDLNGGNYSWE